MWVQNYNYSHIVVTFLIRLQEFHFTEKNFPTLTLVTPFKSLRESYSVRGKYLSPGENL